MNGFQMRLNRPGLAPARGLKKILAAAGLAVLCTAADSAPENERAGDADLMTYYNGDVFPNPKHAKYFDRFLPLGKVGMVLGAELSRDDARLALLVERIRRHGGTVEFAGAPAKAYETLLVVGDTGAVAGWPAGLAVPEREEGYLMHCAETGGQDVVFLKGHDFHGLLWAITAFNQLVTLRDGRPALRAAAIADFPDVPGKRNYSPFSDGAELAGARLGVELMRANRIQYRMGYGLGRRADAWREWIADPEKFGAWQGQIRAIGGFLNPLRIAWSDSVQPLKHGPQIRSKSDEDFALVSKVAMALAEAGGDLMLQYDDFRFPMHPDDVRDFGSAREADIYFINRLYAAVAEKHPDFKILWCPPFYWGPGSDVSEVYGEPRDEYLAACGERLPAGVEIFWTGPRVKSGEVSEDDLNWITGLIRRKPLYWQNAAGHNHGGLFVVYPTDLMQCWRAWYPWNFFGQIGLMTYNSPDAYVNLTLLAYMWNPAAYDPAAAGRQALEKLVGASACSNVVEICRKLEELDQFGWKTPTAAAAKNMELVKARTEELERLYNAAPPPVRSARLGLGNYLAMRKDYLASLVKNPDLKSLLETDEIIRDRARRENGVAADRPEVVVLTPNDFRLNRPPRFYAWKGADRRYVAWINGARSSAPEMAAQFRLTAPPTADYELVMSGLDHNAEPPCRIRVTANGNTVFEGPNPFASAAWEKHTFVVPGKFLHDNENTIRIENIEDSDVMSGAPWFMLHYVLLRPVKP